MDFNISSFLQEKYSNRYPFLIKKKYLFFKSIYHST